MRRQARRSLIFCRKKKKKIFQSQVRDTKTVSGSAPFNPNSRVLDIMAGSRVREEEKKTKIKEYIVEIRARREIAGALS